MKRIIDLFIESQIPALKIGYHSTNSKNTESILREGLKINSYQKGYTNGEDWVISSYGMIPIYLTTSGSYKLSEPGNSSLFQVDCTGLNIGADLGTLIEYGAVLEENGFFFEEGRGAPSYFIRDKDWPYAVLTKNKTFIANSIDLTKTFTVLQDIGPERIKLVDSDAAHIVKESPVFDHNQDSLGDPDKIVHPGITKLEQTQRRYEDCKRDWDLIKKDTIYAGNIVEWFKDDTLKQVRGFLFTPKHEHMGLISGSMPALTKFPNFLGIHLVFIFKQYQGKGNGLALYQNAVENFGGIVSDGTLTKSSLGVWKSLSKKYPTYWYKFGKNPDHPGRILIPINGNDLDDAMVSTDMPFIMSKQELLDD